MTTRRRETFVPAPRDYTPETVPAAPVMAAAAVVVFLLAVAAALVVFAVVMR